MNGPSRCCESSGIPGSPSREADVVRSEVLASTIAFTVVISASRCAASFTGVHDMSASSRKPPMNSCGQDEPHSYTKSQFVHQMFTHSIKSQQTIVFICGTSCTKQSYHHSSSCLTMYCSNETLKHHCFSEYKK